MNTSTHNETVTTQRFAAEFGSWEMETVQLEKANKIRGEFTALLSSIESAALPGNERYFSLAKTKLEEACMFAVKGIAKPTTTSN